MTFNKLKIIPIVFLLNSISPFTSLFCQEVKDLNFINGFWVSDSQMFADTIFIDFDISDNFGLLIDKNEVLFDSSDITNYEINLHQGDFFKIVKANQSYFLKIRGGEIQLLKLSADLFVLENTRTGCREFYRVKTDLSVSD